MALEHDCPSVSRVQDWSPLLGIVLHDALFVPGLLQVYVVQGRDCMPVSSQLSE